MVIQWGWQGNVYFSLDNLGNYSFLMNQWSILINNSSIIVMITSNSSNRIVGLYSSANNRVGVSSNIASTEVSGVGYYVISYNL